MKQGKRKWRGVYRLVAFVLCFVMVGGVIGPHHAKAATQKMYIVLIVDTSGQSNFIDTTTGEVVFSAVSPIDEVKQAAKNFAESLSKMDGTEVAIVSYGRTAQRELEFTDDISTIKSRINNLTMIGGRKNMESALDIANSMLADIKESDAKKTVVLVSPGMTDEGKYDYSGHWNSSVAGGDWYNLNSGINFYAYANCAYLKAEEIKAQGADIYTIGLLKLMEDCPDIVKGPAELFQIVSRDIASEGCYYPVYDINDFGFVFEQMGKEIVFGRTGHFNFSASRTSKDGSSTFYFEDAYFQNPADEYNPSLATMSLCLAMSAFGAHGAVMNDSEQPTIDHPHGQFIWSDGTITKSSERKKQWTNAYELLDSIGFEIIETNGYFKTEPETDSMGVIIGLKNVEAEFGNYTLIAVATRGGGYYSEWSGNFNIGRVGNHAGFVEAKEKAKTFLDTFVSNHIDEIEGPVKLWMAGYSRGGATVNLLAGDVTQRGTIGQTGEVVVSPKSIYAYCFEPPKGLNARECSEQEAAAFTNIFNIVNPNDPVPLVAMAGWGFIRYGVDVVLPTSEYTSKYNLQAARMMNYYRALDAGGLGRTYLVASEYEQYYPIILEKLREEYSLDHSLAASFYRRYQEDPSRPQHVSDSFESYWEDMVKELESGRLVVSAFGYDIDTTAYDGCGVFKNLYEYTNGMVGIRTHCGQESNRLTDYVSMIDLFHEYDIGDTILDIKGIKNLITENYTTQYLNSSLESVLRRTINSLTSNLSRTTYWDDIELWLRKLIELVMKKDSVFDQLKSKVDINSIIDDLPLILLKYFTDGDPVRGIVRTNYDTIRVLSSIVILLNFEDSDLLVDVIYDFIFSGIRDELKLYGVDIDDLESYFTKTERESIKLGLKKLVQAVVDIAASRTGTNALFSLGFNGSKLGMAHYPELCLAWLQSQDPNYDGNNERNYVPYKKRLIRINCPVDISVYDGQGQLVAEIKDNSPQLIEGSSIACAFTENGEKTVTLPMDEAYHIVVKPTDNGTMDASINLLDLAGECVYIENYYDITLVNNQNITIDLPKAYYVDENGLDHEEIVSCSVINGSKEVLASVVLEGDEAKTAEYHVVTNNQNPDGGVVLGGGYYSLGSYALVTAAEYEDCAFSGWYVDDVLVSNERNYRFRVTSDKVLVAKFEGTTQYGRKGEFFAEIEADEGGLIWGEHCVSALDGFPFQIVAIPEEGYEFVGWETEGNCIVENPETEITQLTLIDENVSVVAKFRKSETTLPVEDYGEYEVVSGDVTITYRTESSWTGGYNGAITIQNNSSQELTDWKLLFESENKIAGVWNAQLVDSNNDCYSVKGYDWNSKLAPGQSVKVSFTATGNRPIEPDNYRLLIRKTNPDNSTVNCRFEKTGSWGNGCTGEIVVSNNSQNTISGWKLEFLCESKINDVWNGMLDSREGNKYTVRNAGYNAVIRPGESVRIGVNLTFTSDNAEPFNFVFTGN